MIWCSLWQSDFPALLQEKPQHEAEKEHVIIFLLKCWILAATDSSLDIVARRLTLIKGCYDDPQGAQVLQPGLFTSSQGRLVMIKHKAVNVMEVAWLHSCSTVTKLNFCWCPDWTSQSAAFVCCPLSEILCNSCNSVILQSHFLQVLLHPDNPTQGSSLSAG